MQLLIMRMRARELNNSAVPVSSVYIHAIKFCIALSLCEASTHSNRSFDQSKETTEEHENKA